MARQQHYRDDDDSASTRSSLSSKSGSSSAASTERDALLPKSHAPDVEAAAGSQARIPGVNLRMIVPAMGIGVFLAAMDNTIVVSSYSAIGSELKELNRTSWIATSYMLTTTSFQPLYGKISDIFGRKPSLLFAYAIFGLGCLACGLARNMGELIAARAFAGIGGGGMTTVVSILLSDIVPLRSRGTWQGLLNIIFAFGAATGAPLGGFFCDSIGWRWAFILQLPMTLLAIFVVSLSLHIPESPISSPSGSDDTTVKSRLKRVDFLGAFVLVLAVFLLLLGLDRGGNLSLTDPLVLASLCSALCLFLLFILVESRIAREPFAPPHIVTERTILSACLANFFSFGAYFAVIFYVPLYYQAVTALSASEAGTRLIPAIAGATTGSLAGGIIMQRTGRYYWLTVAAYCTSFTGTIPVMLWAGTVGRSVPAIMTGLTFTAFGNGIGVTTTLIGVIAAAGPKDQAVATAVSYLFRALGTVTGVSVGSMLVQGALRRELERVLTGEDAAEIVRRVRESLDYLRELPPDTALIVVDSYEKAMRNAFVLGMCFTFSSAIVSSFMRDKKLAG